MKNNREFLPNPEVHSHPRDWKILLVCLPLMLLLSACTVDQNALLYPGTVPAELTPTPLLETEAEPALISVEVTKPAVVAEKGQSLVVLETGFTADGYPYMGSAEAPIVLLEYSDFHCPYCQKHNQETLPRYVEEFILTGEVQYIAKDLPLESLHPQARAAHRAAWCVALQSTDAFWWMHEQLYAMQSQHARSQDAPAFYRMLVETYNSDRIVNFPLDVEAFATCQVDLHNEVSSRIDTSIQEARSAGFNGTPTFVMHFRDTPERALPLPGALPFDDLARATRNLEEFLNSMEAEADRADELPYWITDEGLAAASLWLPDQEEEPVVMQGVTNAGDYFLGSPFAEVIVFEFSDFECPFCRKHNLETFPFLETGFVATHKVMWVYKHFPLEIHPHAPFAAEAAMCAGEQGRFWQMHEILFTDPEDWGHSNFETSLLAYGSLLANDASGLVQVTIPDQFSSGTEVPSNVDWLDLWDQTDMAPFDEAAYAACLEGNHYEDLISQGIADVSSIIRGTPTFLIWHRQYGALAQPIVGSLEKETFANVFDQIFIQLSALEGADSE